MEKGKEWTAYKSLMLGGKVSDPATLPAIVDLGTIPPAVQPGIIRRATELIRTIKAHPNYNEAMGEDLGIIGEEDTTDFSTIKPAISSKFEGNKLWIIWKKGPTKGIAVYIDLGDGAGWRLAGYDFRPDFDVKEALPAAGQSAVWKFKAIHVDDDLEEAGQWSDEISVTVTGAV